MKLEFSATHRIRRIAWILFAFNAIIFSSCDKDSGPTGPIPVITGVSPQYGQAGINVTISGINFGSDPQATKVAFTGLNNSLIYTTVNGTGQSSGETVLYAAVPRGAITGKVYVVANGVEGQSASDFEVLTPVGDLTISPASASSGTSMIIMGAMFSTMNTENEVTFATQNGGRTSAIASVSSDGTYIKVLIPDLAANGVVQVSTNKTVHESKIEFVKRPCDVSTYAGSSNGYIDAIGIDAKFNRPRGMVVSSNNVYMADAGNHLIRKIDLSNGNVSTMAGGYGFADGIGDQAKFNSPEGITAGDDGKLYVADTWNHSIRKIDLATGQVTTVAGNGSFGYVDGIGTAAQLRLPTGITTAADGTLYFTEGSDSHRIRKFNPVTGAVTTLAGTGASGKTDGAGYSAQFYFPEGIVAVNGSLYVADNGNGLIRRINLSNNMVSTLAGGAQGFYKSSDGVGKMSSFNSPVGIATDGTYLFVTDAGYLRRVDLTTAAVTTLAGTLAISFEPKNGACGAAEFSDLYGIARANDGTLLVTEASGFSIDLSLIRKIIP